TGSLEFGLSPAIDLQCESPVPDRALEQEEHPRGSPVDLQRPSGSDRERAVASGRRVVEVGAGKATAAKVDPAPCGTAVSRGGQREPARVADVVEKDVGRSGRV